VSHLPASHVPTSHAATSHVLAPLDSASSHAPARMFMLRMVFARMLLPGRVLFWMFMIGMLIRTGSVYHYVSVAVLDLSNIRALCRFLRARWLSRGPNFSPPLSGLWPAGSDNKSCVNLLYA